MAACQIRARCGVVWVLVGLPQSCSRHGSNSVSNGALPLAGGVQIDKAAPAAPLARQIRRLIRQAVTVQSSAIFLGFDCPARGHRV